MGKNLARGAFFRFLIRLEALGVGLGFSILTLLRCHVDKVSGWKGVTVFFNNHGEGPFEYYVILPLLIVSCAAAIVFTFVDHRDRLIEARGE